MPAYNQAMLPPDFVVPYRHNLDEPMPQYIPDPGPTGVVVHTKFAQWAVPTSLFIRASGPRIWINGHEVSNAQWGETWVSLPPGLHHIRVMTRGSNIAPLFGFPRIGEDHGPADAMLPVVPDHATHTHYSSPVVAALLGGLDPVAPRRSPGYRWAFPVWLVVMGFLLGVVPGLIIYYGIA
ncbi:hypothetical protein GV794_24785 [Nocardia cyriacigeorgica]|uniref:PEGA domain-containing protein n=1 Tax=Nocardia cyriacigeorgica TaxID=135487 RepID=A0A6P1DEV6_9NOCA|nr:hypothetical protein [Nocardia cyriacigeorgica]NEW42588.1 hypothetical protein [Nocardia cyriacigeorgica]NEW47290.1 hypothetical protein [Nocardia cyriacigeorgica]NEW58829.1 hypothetical protein [Nocardia cyriacigeorgica]